MSSLRDENAVPDRSERPQQEPVNRLPRLMLIVVVVVSVVVLIFAAGAYLFGNKVKRLGYSQNTTIRQIIIGNDVVNVPENVIRFDEQRQATTLERLDLHFHWPSFEGYSDARREIFLALSGNRENLIFASIAKRKIPYDMSSRFFSVYSRLLEGGEKASVAGLVYQNLSPEAGYAGEELHYQKEGSPPYVVRCQRIEGDVTAATCMRDVNIGLGLSLTYRFSRDLLPQWLPLENAMRNITASYMIE